MNKKLIALVVIIVAGLVIAVAVGNERTSAPQPAARACTQEAKLCPDGSSVGRTGPNCDFAACPSAPAPTISADAYPLYAGATWGTPTASAMEGMDGATLSSDAITGVSDIAAIALPFENYYKSKLTTLGWTEDTTLDAGGPGSAETGYKKDDARIVVGYAADFLGTKPDQPVSYPCSLTLSVWSGTKKAPAYENASYSIDGRSVALKDGISVVPDGAGSASSTTTSYFGTLATGDLNGDGTDDAAFLLSHSDEGSGTFYYLVAAIQNGDGSYTGTDAVLLGDRIAPQSTEIQGGTITVNYADRKPNEPMTAKPSVGVSKQFKVVNGQLVETE